MTTLFEEINKHKGDSIKVGSATGFVYCGPVSDDICQIMAKHSDEEFKRLHSVLDRFNRENETFNDKWANAYARRYEKFKSGNDILIKHGKTPLNFDEFIEKFNKAKIEDRKRIDRSIKEYTDRIENYIPFLEREVKEVYPAPFSGSLIIIFDGLESGDYWDEEEYAAKRKRRVNIYG